MGTWYPVVRWFISAKAHGGMVFSEAIKASADGMTLLRDSVL